MQWQVLMTCFVTETGKPVIIYEIVPTINVQPSNIQPFFQALHAVMLAEGNIKHNYYPTGFVDPSTANTAIYIKLYTHLFIGCL